MKLVLFTEIHYRGGLDTFLITLINAWPYVEDELALICNSSHPGLEGIESSLKRPCRIIRHKLPGQSEWYQGLGKNRYLANRVSRGGLSMFRKICGYPLFVVYLVALTLRFRQMHYDRLMVVNGGYPASMNCRAASVAWSLAGLRPLSIHNFHNFAQTTPRWRRWIEDVIDLAVLRSSRAMVSVSASCLESLRLRSQFLKQGVYKFIYNGIEPIERLPVSPSEVRSELGIPSDAPLCLMLATFEPRKGHEFFLRAFRQVADRLPHVRALICGDGSAAEVAHVTSLVSAFGLSRHVVLQKHRQDVDALLRNAQVLVVPSQAYESFGLVVVEAMAMKVPVVATRVGGIPEVMADGAGGFLCDVHDADGFAQAILKILRDPGLATELGELGFKRYSTEFTAEKMANEYAKLILEDAVRYPPDLPLPLE